MNKKYMRLAAAFVLCLAAATVGAEPDLNKIADQLDQIAAELRGGSKPPKTAAPQLPIVNADRVAALKKLRSAKSPYWATIQAAADRTGTKNPVYDDDGQFAALVYRTTLDRTCAAKAWDALYADVSGPIGPVDNVREYFLEYLLVYSWIADELSADQKQQFAAAIQKWADVSLGNGPATQRGGFQFSDSDQTIGQYFGLAMMDALGIVGRPGEQGVAPGGLLNSQIAYGGAQGLTVGGLDATAADRTTARNTIRQYVEQLAAGGEWFESRQYNSNTVVLLLMGWMALADIHGQDHFPEIARWIPDACSAAVTDFTPDLKSGVEWGDDERAGNLDLYKQLPYLAALQAAAMRIGDPASAAKVGRLMQGLMSADPGANIRGRFYYFYDPSFPIGEPPPDFVVNYSPGVGMVRRIDSVGRPAEQPGDKLFFAFAPSRLRVDHECSFIADVNLYARGAASAGRPSSDTSAGRPSQGEWVLRHPIAYSPITDSAAGVNAVLVAGCSAMLDKGPLACESTADYTYFVGQTKGQIYEASAWNSPPEWLHELTRTVFYLPSAGAIFLCDRVNADDPLAARPDLSGYLRPDKEAIQTAKHRVEVVWHMPSQPKVAGGTVSWQTPLAQTVRLDSFSTTGSLAADTFDEKQLWSDVSSIEAGQKGWQVRLHLDADRTWNTVLTVIRLNPGADEPKALRQRSCAGWSVGGVNVLFGTAPASRQLKVLEAAVPVSGQTYLVGCDGSQPVVTASPR